MASKRKLKNQKKDSIARRLIFILIITLFSLFFVGVFQVMRIKIVHGNEYEALAISNQINKVQDKIINPNRGNILDRNKQALAVSTTVYNVILDVRVLLSLELEQQKETLNGLKETLGIPDEELNGFVALDAQTKKPVNDTNWLVIRKQIPFQTGKTIESADLKCVYLEQDTKRTYPHDSLAAQVIGFIRNDSWGLENVYNEELTGVPGRTFRTYEIDNNIVTREIDPQTGRTLVTTIDQTIQQFAENICKQTYQSCADSDHKAELTAIMVMNPMTGEIIAMSQYPTFNLNNPTELSPEAQEIYERVKAEKLEAGKSEEDADSEAKSYVYNTIWRNFNITDSFEPGSIFKPVTATAAYEEGIISASEKFYCGGNKVFPSDTIPCNRLSGHGSQTVEQALANSCNVALMDIGAKLGSEKFYKYQRDFGFGEKTGIDLPAETSAESLMYKLSALNQVELATSSFGQGFNSTAIQDLNAFAAIINGGKLMKPYVVSQIIDDSGNIISETQPEIVRRVISEESSDFFRKGMQSVINPSGTGKKAIIDGYSIGGKTGTAQQGKRDENEHTLDFVAYLPVDDPQYIAMAVIHKPKNYTDGVVSPVPMLRELLINIINYKSITPDSDVETAEGVYSGSANEVNLPDLTNKPLNEAVKTLNELGLDFEFAGSGGDTVTKQFPAGNVKTPVDTSILLYIGSSAEDIQLTQIPDVTGMKVSEAQEVLSKSGFECSIADYSEPETKNSSAAADESTENTTEGGNTAQGTTEKIVYQQIPSAGANVEKGMIVKIKIS